MSKSKKEATEVEIEETELEVMDSSETENNDAPTDGGDEDLKALKEKAAKADEHWERILRMTAELENFKKRSARDREDAVRYANERFVGQLLPVLDSFTMAVAATESSSEQDIKSLKVGVKMILGQFQTVLKDMGVEELDAAGKVFDPSWQEAMSQEESSEVEEGKVLQQLRKGYRLKDRLIRPASVVVAKAPENNDGAAEDNDGAAEDKEAVEGTDGKDEAE